ncbi:multicopper oxidase-domain-containing protein [Podospora conica]|nr:multicopper oxidase-domain-containing protein [Schizothecium conicum]
MLIVGRVWRAVTSFLAIVGLAPPDNALHVADQVPLNFDGVAPSSVPQHDTPHRLPHGPIFKPPGGLPEGDGSKFTCDYSKMVGFKQCSTPENRGCWLTNGLITWGIKTNYEEAVEDAPTPFAVTPLGIDRHYNLTVKNGTIIADGLNFVDGKMLDDGTGPKYPGPWIQACWGDTIYINVTNELYGLNGTSMHWHGLRQWFTMHMDGVNGITQCPIAPGDHFVYKFKATQYGSSWYHSHYSIQYADGLVGPISIHGPTSAPYDIAPDLPLLLTDWAHNSAFNVLSTKKMEWPSILINGQGNVSAFTDTNPPGLDPSRAKPYTLSFSRNQSSPAQTQKHLLRIINTSFDTTFVFSIDNHLMTVVEADFVPIHPWPESGPTQSITIGIGQRYNIIVESLPRPAGASDDSDSYWIRTYIPDDCTNDASPTGANYMKTGILLYDSSSTTTPTSDPWAGATAQPCADNPSQFSPVVEWKVGPAANNGSGETELITGAHSPITDYVFARLGLQQGIDTAKRTAFRIDFSSPSFLNLNVTRPWTASEVVIPEDLTKTDWIYLTLSNVGGFGPHPMHLHGHDFAIVYSSPDPPVANQTITLNLDNPPRRDVVLVPRGGFVIIAFRADNPGTWLMHCHIARHAAEGLGLQILERVERAREIWPSVEESPALTEATRVCENWKAWQRDCHNWAVGCGKVFQDDSGV